MRLPQKGVLLRIFVDENKKFAGKPVYEYIVLKAKELKMAGATVIKGIMGFGAESHLHMNKFLRLSEDLPIIIEIIDSQENIQKFLPLLDEIVEDGLVTMEEVDIVKYRPDKNKA
jgi:PII-like signaling protein